MTDIAPWQVRSSRVLLNDRWMRLRADECVTASGATLNPYYVLQYTDWVNTVAVTESNEVVVIRQYRHGIGATVLELPGGMVDAGETPHAAAARELTEETGYTVAMLHHVCSLPANPAMQTNRIHTYLGTQARLTAPQATEAGEDLTVHAMPLTALLAVLQDGSFGQSMQLGPLILALQAAGLLQIQISG